MADALQISSLENIDLSLLSVQIYGSNRAMQFTMYSGATFNSIKGVKWLDENVFTQGSHVTPGSLRFEIGVSAPEINANIKAGERIEIVYDGGQTINVYLPEFQGPVLGSVYVATGGSTYWDPALTNLAQAAPSLPAIGQIVANDAPEKLWRFQAINQTVTLKNIGAGPGNIYYRISHPFDRKDFVKSVFLAVGEQKTVPIFDFETGKNFVMGQNNTFILDVWTSSPDYPGSANRDDNLNWNVPMIQASSTIDSVNGPEQAPTGIEIEFQVQYGIMERRTDGLVNVFFRMRNKATNEILKEDFKVAQDRLGVAFSVKTTMPDGDLTVISESGVVNAYRPETDDFGERIDDMLETTVLIGETEGIGSIFDLIFPNKVPVGNKFTMHFEWVNLSDVIDTFFARLINQDTGEIMWESIDDISPNSGRVTNLDPEFTMPETNLNLRFEVGHDERGTDIVDDFRDFTIIGFIPAFLNVDTFPVKGIVFVNGAGIGQAPQSLVLEAGTYNISFGAVDGFVVPPPQTVTLAPAETTDILAEYIEGPEGEAGINPLLALGGLGLVGGVILLANRKKGK